MENVKKKKSFEMPEISHPTTQFHIPEERYLQQHRREHLMSEGTVNFVRQFLLVGAGAPVCPSLRTVLMSQVDTGTVRLHEGAMRVFCDIHRRG